MFHQHPITFADKAKRREKSNPHHPAFSASMPFSLYGIASRHCVVFF
jgi:hypothetical protein